MNANTDTPGWPTRRGDPQTIRDRFGAERTQLLGWGIHVTDPLVDTGDLASNARRRLLETGAWISAAQEPYGLRLGAGGYVATAQVRLLHAHVRHTILAKAWDPAEWGTPISQTDTARTWFDFTYVPMHPLLHKIGYEFTADEVGDFYRLWRCIGHLLGIDPRFLSGISDHAGAAPMRELIDSADERPGEATRALVEAVLDLTAEILHGEFDVPAGLAHDLVRAVIRAVYGDQRADDPGFPTTELTALISLAAAQNRLYRPLLRDVPTFCEQSSTTPSASNRQQLPPALRSAAVRLAQHPLQVRDDRLTHHRLTGEETTVMRSTTTRNSIHIARPAAAVYEFVTTTRQLGGNPPRYGRGSRRGHRPFHRTGSHLGRGDQRPRPRSCPFWPDGRSWRPFRTSVGKFPALPWDPSACTARSCTPSTQPAAAPNSPGR